METMNVFQKMAKVQYEFSLMPIKKSGRNFNQKTNKLMFEYFELKDITPPLLRLCKENGLVFITSITYDGDKNVYNGSITIVNADNPQDERIVNTITLRPAEVMLASNTQKDGAVVTYARRYLLMLAFNIVEPDMIDAEDQNERNSYNSNAKNPPRPRVNQNDSKPMIPNPSSAWGELMKFFGWTGNNSEVDKDASSRAHDTIEAMEIHIKSPKDLTIQNAEDIRKWMADNPDFRHVEGPESFVGDDL